MTPLAAARALLLGTALSLGAVSTSGAAPADLDATQLVARLGGSSFEAREAASARLLLLGKSAAPALRVGLKSTDAEVRRRCADLLPVVLRTDADRRLDKFLLEGSGKADAALPGWNALRQVAGHDVSARLLYAQLYREDRALLEALARNPAELAGQVQARAMRLQQRGFGFINARPSPIRHSDVAGLFVAVACAPSLPQTAFNQFANVGYNPEVRDRVLGSPVLRRLAGRALGKHGTGQVHLYQTLYVASNLQLDDFIERELAPIVLKQVFAALTQPPDVNKLVQPLSVACNLGLQAKIAPRVRPIMRVLAIDVVSRPDRQYHVYQVLSILQNLKMQDTIDTVMKPAVLKLARQAADRPDDTGTFYRALNLARSINSPEALDALKVSGRKMAVAAARSSDYSRLFQALHLTQNLGLEEAREGVLAPAVRRFVLARLEQTDDLSQLTQSAQLCDTAGLRELRTDTLEPMARRRAAEAMAKSPGLPQIQQVHNLAQQLGLADVTDKVVRPALRKALVAATEQPLHAGTLNQLLGLARTLQLKEGVVLATRAAQSKTLDGHTRGNAVLFVANVGTREDLARLEPLLGDAATLGQIGLNGTTMQTQVGDVVLAALVHGNGLSLADYGFTYFQMVPGFNALNMPALYFGFPSAAARAAALGKWRKWSAARKS